MEQQFVMTELCRKRFEPAVNRIKELLETKEDCIVVVIDGMSASGKSTLGLYLKEIFDCNVFHMDDFFLQDDQRTKERLNEIGGNVDYERCKEEVLVPILNRDTVMYRPFCCKTKIIEKGTEIPFKRLNIVEGSYSQHPYFAELYADEKMCVFRIFTEISEKLQIERIRKRNGDAMLKRFMLEWIPKENAYFKRFQIKDKSEMYLS